MAEAAPVSTINDYMIAGARILVVNAHPDDETLFGPILAKSCIEMVNACHFAVMTTGEGGDCSLKNGCPDGLGMTRMREMEKAAGLYGATLAWGEFRNFPHTGTQESWWYDHIRADWSTVTDPVGWIQIQIDQFRPDIVMTVDPDHGFYGHAEHILVGRLVAEALGLRTPPHTAGVTSTTQGHQPRALYTVLNHYWMFRPFVGRDLAEATEQWSAHQSCASDISCMTYAVDIAQAHASQKKSGIGLFSFASRFIKNMYLRQTLID